MLSTSNHIFNYTARLVLKHFRTKNIKEGERYNVFLESLDDVLTQVNAIKAMVSEEGLSSKTVNFKTVEAEAILLGDVQLLLFYSSERINEDYLTTLRNNVSASDGEFKNSAVLFIHNTQLDSIIGGTLSLTKEGMPLHVDSIVEALKSDIENSNSLQKGEQELLKVLLKKKKENIFEDNSSFFDYEVFLEILDEKKISPEHYRKLGVFKDKELVSTFSSSSKIEERVTENIDWFNRIDNTHNYGNVREDLDRYFLEGALNKIHKEDWYERDFTEIISWKDKKKEKLPPEIEDIGNSNSLWMNFWVRSDGDSKAAKRRKNIIVFNRTGQELVEAKIRFDKVVISKGVKDKEIIKQRSIRVQGKSIIVKIESSISDVSFALVEYKDPDSGARFIFRFAVVPFSEDLVQDIQSYYKVDKNSILLQTDNSNVTFNSRKEEGDIEEYSLGETYQLNDERHLKIEFDVQEEEKLDFNLEYKELIIPFVFKPNTSIKPKIITGRKVWKLKRELQAHFQYDSVTEKLTQRYDEYFTKEDFRANLKQEAQVLEIGGLFWEEEKSGELKESPLAVNPKLKEAYNSLFSYYRTNNLLPSLSYLNDELKELFQTIVTLFIEEVESIKHEKPLENNHRDLAKIGVIEEVEKEQRIKFSPLHPLNLAYQLELNNVLGSLDVNEEVLKRLTPLNLIPYIYGEEKAEYLPIENSHSAEWLYFSSREISKNTASKRYVKQLVANKLREFTKHFSYLYPKGTNAPIKINAINQGDCKEILQGVFDFYKNLLTKNKNLKIEDLYSIDISIYGSEEIITKFEELSFYNDLHQIKEEFEVEFPKNSFSEEDVLNAYRDKVHFYTKEGNSYEYAHISFYQFDENQVVYSYNTTDSMNTGISLGGLMSDVPSVFENKSYRTGFGTKNITDTKNSLIEFVELYNALVRVAFSTDPFEKGKAICSVVKQETRDSLELLYDKSQWITFIDPKVDLNFFKNTRSDLIIIHYSDQYNNASGYDAITVTQKSSQYQFIIEEFLRKHKVEFESQDSYDLINLFNAINGDWLLKLIARKDQFPREKISILSAVKASLALFYHPNIVWVPISLEEILRISGNAGLKQKEGFFSSKLKRESAGDDLLLIGVENLNGQLYLHFYPIEVKIGHNQKLTLDKAIKQGTNTAKLLKETLNVNDYTAEIYKNFFAKLVLVNAQKMQMYNVWEEQNWMLVIEQYRKQIMSNDFKVGTHLEELIGEFGVISFKTDSIQRTLKYEENGSIIELLEKDDGYINLIKSVEHLKNMYLSDISTIKKDQLLYSNYEIREVEPILDKVIELSKEEVELPPLKDKAYKIPKLAKVADDNNLKDEYIKEEPKEEKSETQEPLNVLFGHNVNNQEPVLWYPTSTNKVMHTNTGIIGTMGTGKTQFTRAIISQLHKGSSKNVNKTKIGILIFDYNEDYISDDFVSFTNASVYQPFFLPYNPLAFDTSDIEDVSVPRPLFAAAALRDTITRAFNLGNVQGQLLEDAMIEAYESVGIDVYDSSTWQKTPPTINDVCDIFLEDESVKKDSLYTALSRLRGYRIFQPDALKAKPLFDLIEGVTVINLHGISESTKDLIVGITLDQFYSQMQASGHSDLDGEFREITKMIIIDEADNCLIKGFNSIKKILKEGRKYGVGTVLSTQFLNHFSTNKNDYSKYILTWIIHRVNEISSKDVSSLFKANSKDKVAELQNAIKSLDKHYSIINLAGSEPIKIKDKAFWELLKDFN